MNTKTQNKLTWLDYFNEILVCYKKICEEKITNCIDNINTVDNSRRVN